MKGALGDMNQCYDKADVESAFVSLAHDVDLAS